MNKNILIGLLSVVFLFGIIVSFTGIAGKYLGKNVEMVLLVVIAVVLVIMLIIDRNKKE